MFDIIHINMALAQTFAVIFDNALERLNDQPNFNNGPFRRQEHFEIMKEL